MRIRKPRSLTTTQLMIVTAVGVLSGAYIWQPLILKYRKESAPDQSEVRSDPVEISSVTSSDK